jgi:hypothetical protein
MVRCQETIVEEMNLGVVLARRPAVALVDDFAHRNVPHLRHAKRWQDVENLLEAGIDVISTVSIEHLDSRIDVVEKITGASPPETVPDRIVRAARARDGGRGAGGPSRPDGAGPHLPGRASRSGAGWLVPDREPVGVLTA